jgi:FKBP-type peptidyl-prolyl cis-trans isomerase FkpA
MMRSIHVLAAFAALMIVGCQQGKSSEPAQAPAPPSSAPKAEAPAAPSAGTGREIATPSGLKYEDMVVGNGTIAEDGMRVTVNYTGWLTNGTKFDSSLDPGHQPLTLVLGARQVIRGWDEGLKGMRVGGKRKLTIPPDLAYGAQGAGDVIPPNSTLIFEVELLDAKSQ